MKHLATITAPIRTVSEANTHDHYITARKRHKKQKNDVKYYFNYLSAYKNKALTIKLIRVSPRQLDEHDNLKTCFKYIVDALAEVLNPGKAPGRADDSKLLEWQYEQEKGEPKQRAIRVVIYERD